MNSLLSYGGYGSDDDYEDSGDEKQTDSRHGSSKNYRTKNSSGTQVDVNYDEVQMDLSEDSNDSKSEKESTPKPRDDHRKEDAHRSSRDNNHRSRGHSRDRDRDDHKSSSRSEYSRDRRSRSRGDREDTRHKDRSNRDGRDSRERSDRYGSRDDDRGKDRDRYGRDRREKDRRRSRSKDRRRSKSPRKSDRDKSRSKSRDRDRRGGYSQRYDRASNKMDKLDKMGIEIKTPDCQYVKPSDLQKSMDEEKRTSNTTEKDRFFMPGITGRFREQIERRKLLWQKKEQPEAKQEMVAPAPSFVSAAGSGPGGSRTTKVWEATTFAQDTDGKVASKFKRLMGIRNASEGANSATDVLKKQEEMFSSMEQQYEVARTATHTMRGVGLGFGSYQR